MSTIIKARALLADIEGIQGDVEALQREIRREARNQSRDMEEWSPSALAFLQDAAATIYGIETLLRHLHACVTCAGNDGKPKCPVCDGTGSESLPCEQCGASGESIPPSYDPETGKVYPW